MGGLTIACFLATNLLATTIGLLFALIIKPGNFGDTISEARKALNETNHNRLDIDETLMGLMLNLVPNNFFEAAFRKTKLEVVFANDGTPNFETAMESGANVFGLLCFSILFGLALQSLGNQGEIPAQFFQQCRQGLLWIVSILLW